MVIVPPPVFAIVYLLISAGLSYLLGWPAIPAESIALFESTTACPQTRLSSEISGTCRVANG
jgi:hypothetical protein